MVAKTRRSILFPGFMGGLGALVHVGTPSRPANGYAITTNAITRIKVKLKRLVGEKP